MKFKEKQKNKGITLIALVITIIVLLILAGVTIATLFGDNGVLTKATEAKNEQADATVEEAVKLAWNEYQMMLNEPTGKNESGTKIASTSKVKIQGEEKKLFCYTCNDLLAIFRGRKTLYKRTRNY